VATPALLAAPKLSEGGSRSFKNHAGKTSWPRRGMHDCAVFRG